MNIERQSSLLILGACFLWAIDLLVRYPVTLEMSYVSIVFMESLIGLMFVSPWMIRNRETFKKLSKRDWIFAAFIGGIGMSIAGYLQTACIQKATPGLFSFFQIFQPFFVISAAHYFLKEKIDNMFLYWGVWVVLSALLMFSVDLGLMLQSEIIFTDILIALLTMLIWGMCTILGKKFLQNQSFIALVSLRWAFAFVFSLVILIAEGESFPVKVFTDYEIFLRFIFMALIAGIFSMSLYYKGLGNMEAGKVSFIEISYSAFGMILSAIYTFEALSLFQLIGAALFFVFLFFFLSKPFSVFPSIRTR